jgi:hypothetical protein
MLTLKLFVWNLLFWKWFFKEAARGWGANSGPLDFIYFLIFITLLLSHSVVW